MSKEKDPRHAVRSTPSAVSTTVEHRALGDGISGSAMAVPPPKAATYAVRPDKPVKTVKYGLRKSLLVSKSDTSNCNTKQKKEVTDRSQELKDSLVQSADCLAFIQRDGSLASELKYYYLEYRPDDTVPVIICMRISVD